jgi:hypothetical protein
VSALPWKFWKNNRREPESAGKRRTEMQGLENTLLEKVIRPYREYRGNQIKPGRPTTFEKFLTDRPDDGEKIIISGVQLKTVFDLMRHAGIDPMDTTTHNILTREDDFKWLVGPWIEDTVWRGYAGEATNPALWLKLCYAAAAPSKQETFKRVNLRFEGRPVPTGELAHYPTARLTHGEEDISWKKTAWGLDMSNEFLRFCPLPMIETFLVEIGRVQQAFKNEACVNAIVNGMLANGADSCPVIGVTDPLNGVDGKGLQYRDFLEPWALGDEIGRNWLTFLYPRSMAQKVETIPEFRPLLDVGAFVIPLRSAQDSRPVRYVSPTVPPHQVIMIDTRDCVRERVAIPFHIMEDNRIDTYSKQISFFESSIFEKTGEKSCMAIDETLSISTHPIPSWFELGKNR